MSVEKWTDDNPAVIAGLLSGRQRWTRLLPAMIIGLITLMGISMVLDGVFDRIQAELPPVSTGHRHSRRA